MKYFLLSLLAFSAFFSRIDRHFLKKNGSFSPSFILPDWSKCPQLDTNQGIDLAEILDQPFIYLTKGRESFVFLSRDQQWVIKFFRLPRCVLLHSHKKNAGSISNLQKSFENYKRAAEDLYTETRVVYTHLKPTSSLQTILLIDRLGVEHACNLNYAPFLIQRFGAPFFQVFDQEKSPSLLIQKTVALFERLYEKGFIDKDPIFDKNFGVIEDEPFIIDVGQLEKSDSLGSKPVYLKAMTHSLGLKLEKESPSLYSYYKNLLH